MNTSINDTKVAPSDAPRYLTTSDPMYDTIDNEIRKSYPDVCVCWIEDVVNPFLLERYELYKATLKEPNEKLLFHGTSKEAARAITLEGFRPELNTVSAHGKGVYFSESATYSSGYSIMKSGHIRSRRRNPKSIRPLEDMNAKAVDYSKILYLLVCKVAVGRVRKSGHEHVIPEGYNSFGGPGMFIVDRKEACIPAYLAAFYPDATKIKN